MKFTAFLRFFQILRLTDSPIRPRRASKAPRFSSNINMLPDDVLQELFEWVVCDAGPTFPVINSETLPPQLVLASVCKRWRAVVLSISYLWSGFTVDCAGFGIKTDLPSSRVALFVERGRESPMSLNLISVDRENLYLSVTLEKVYGELLGLIFPRHRCWKNIKLVLDHELAKRFLRLEPLAMETTESLSIDFRTKYWFDQDPHHIPATLVTNILRFPKLKQLYFRTCSPWSYVPVESERPFWEKLTHVDVHVSYGTPYVVGLKLLDFLRSAVYIQLNLYVLRPNADGLTREVLRATSRLRESLPKRIELPALKELVLSVDHEVDGDYERMLDMIVAPNLEALALSLDPVSDNDGLRLIREAKRLVDEAANLKSVYVRLWGSQYFEREEVAAFVWACYQKKGMTSIAVAGDHMNVLPALQQFVKQEKRLEDMMTLTTLTGMSKFDALK